MLDTRRRRVDPSGHADVARCLPCRGSAVTDTLSDVLRAVRLRGAVYFTVEGTSPWVAEAPPSREIGAHIMPGTEHVIEFHVVTSGWCYGGLLDQPAFRLEAGDVLVFPQGDAHVVSSAPGMRGGPDAKTLAGAARIPLTISLHGGGPQRAELICGFLGCDARPFNPLLAALPRVLVARGTGASNSVLRRLVDLALVESSSPRSGSECVLARLSELLFVEVVRDHVEGLPPEEVGWFSGLRDPTVGLALQSLHERPTQAWSLEALAKEVGVSRSILAARFSHFVGIAPMQYLAQWRIQLAASLLRTSTSSLAQIAESVGYGSEAALSKAFKRLVGVAPAPYRQGARSADGAPNLERGSAE
jgi:AraC-like DNA-binding protein